jgi:hypothetical protein
MTPALVVWLLLPQAPGAQLSVPLSPPQEGSIDSKDLPRRRECSWHQRTMRDFPAP